MEQAKLPPEMRTSLQKVTTVSPKNATDKQKLNDEAFAAYKASLLPCPNCGRTFGGADRLQVHLRSCKPGSSSRPPPRPSTVTTKAPVESSVNLPTNIKSVNTTLTTKPAIKSQPSEPRLEDERPIEASTTKSVKFLEEMNSVHDGLAECSKCARSFAIERIQKHESVCKGKVEKKEMKVMTMLEFIDLNFQDFSKSC